MSVGRGRCRFVGFIVDSITTNHATRPSLRRRSMMPVSGLRLDPLVPVPDHVVVEHVDEPVHRDAREAALVEELLPGPAEEALRGGVVRTASLRARRTRQVVVLADADPLGPPVVAATVGMDDWFLTVLERGARVGEHAVGQRRVRAGADRPGDRHAVVAVDHGRQVRLARGDREFREVREPQHVRPLGAWVFFCEPPPPPASTRSPVPAPRPCDATPPRHHRRPWHSGFVAAQACWSGWRSCFRATTQPYRPHDTS